MHDNVQIVLDPPASSMAKPDVQLRHFDFVDALRGFAIVGVMSVHSMYYVMDISRLKGGLVDFAENGKYGVHLFFIISAFTLVSSLHTRIKIDRRPIVAFYIRRFFRIAPLFWVAILFFGMQHPAWREMYAPNGIRLPHFVSTLLFFHGWYPSTVNSVVPGGWSIAAEWMFYLSLPALFFSIRSLPAAMWVTVISALAVTALTPIALATLNNHFPESWHRLNGIFIDWTFPAVFAVFCCGFVLYYLLVDRPPGKPIGKRVSTYLPLLALPAFLFFKQVPGQLSAAAILLAFAYALGRFPIRLLVNPATRFVGKVSFSAYIWHFVALNHSVALAIKLVGHPSWPDSINGAVQMIAAVIMTLLMTLPLATASYYLIEVPGQMLGKWIIKSSGVGK
jgi:peptidoglycan/LPS O-acetylase OafA/YrhL